MSPSQHSASVITASGSVEIKQVDIPKPGVNQVLVKVAAAAVNHIDPISAARLTNVGKVSGCDFAGVVVELGPGAEAFRKVGERIASFTVASSSYTAGAFAEYALAKADLCFTIPENVSWEDAAQLPISFLTACQMLYQSLGFRELPEPAAPEPATPVLVYGASSTSGHYNLQLAKLGGLKVFATSSPRNFELVRGLGADEVYDYRDPDAPRKIKEVTQGKLRYAADTISELGSDAFIARAFADEGGKIAIILPHGEGEQPREGIELVYSLTFDFLFDRTKIYYIGDKAKYTKIVQYAKAAGIKVYGTCPPRHFATARALGVDEVYDSKDPEAPSKIKQLSGADKFAVHGIPEFGSDFVFGVTANGAKKAIVLPYGEEVRDGVEAIYSLGYGFAAERSSTDVSYIPDGPKYTKLGSDLLAQGKLKPSPVRVLPKGLASVPEAFKALKEGVSGQKIVIRIADTPNLG